MIESTGLTEAAKAEWLSLWNAANDDELRRSVADAILHAVEVTPDSEPPIQLSKAASTFQIRKAPVFDRKVHHGFLEYLPESGEFAIHINPGVRHRWFEGDSSIGIKGRLRFTYAHEFAHRFFYVPDESHGWIRGVQLLKRHNRLAVAAVADLEETLCDRIAGDVLVPDTILPRHTDKLLEAYSHAEGWHLADALLRLSERFLVSLDTLLIRLQRSVRNGHIDCRRDLVCFIVAVASFDGIRRGAAARRRVVAPISKDAPFLYPGREIQELGGELEAALKRTARGTAVSELHCTIRHHGEWQLVGWVRRLYGRDADARFLVWGTTHSR